ncbi:MAG: molecular chaperone [Lentimicrobium sp.]
MNSLSVSDLLEQAECYKILAMLFSQPEAGIHENKKTYDTLVKSAGHINQKALGLAKRLRSTGLKLDLTELLSEFTGLFDTERNQLFRLCSSCYIDNNRPDLADGRMNRITEIYQTAGFDTSHLNISKDHISVGLDFIYHLLLGSAKGFKNNDMSVINFFGDLRCLYVREYMVKWVPEFTRYILINSKSPFYLQLAILTRTILINCPGYTPKI